jgi:hypothetical protein
MEDGEVLEANPDGDLVVDDSVGDRPADEKSDDGKPREEIPDATRPAPLVPQRRLLPAPILQGGTRGTGAPLAPTSGGVLAEEPHSTTTFELLAVPVFSATSGAPEECFRYSSPRRETPPGGRPNGSAWAAAKAVVRTMDREPTSKDA